MPTTRLIPAAARDAHDRLVAALGTENHPAQWMVFMATVTELLPEVLSSGRPSADAIRRSPIGQLGFGSWKAMVEAPVAEGGLGWSWSAWRQWRRAWHTVEQHPWLREQSVTAAEVNRYAQQFKDDFPASPDELEQKQQQIEAERAEKRSQTLSALQSEVEGLRAQADEDRAALSKSEAMVATLRDELKEARKAIRAEASARTKAEQRVEAAVKARKKAEGALAAERRKPWYKRLLGL
jgi:hypothetical protein